MVHSARIQQCKGLLVCYNMVHTVQSNYSFSLFYSLCITYSQLSKPSLYLATQFSTEPPISLSHTFSYLATHLPTEPPVSLRSHPSLYWANPLYTEHPTSLYLATHFYLATHLST